MFESCRRTHGKPRRARGFRRSRGLSRRVARLGAVLAAVARPMAGSASAQMQASRLRERRMHERSQPWVGVRWTSAAMTRLRCATSASTGDEQAAALPSMPSSAEASDAGRARRVRAFLARALQPRGTRRDRGRDLDASRRRQSESPNSPGSRDVHERRQARLILAGSGGCRSRWRPCTACRPARAHPRRHSVPMRRMPRLSERPRSLSLSCSCSHPLSIRRIPGAGDYSCCTFRYKRMAVRVRKAGVACTRA
jgi:hypothetical protein